MVSFYFAVNLFHDIISYSKNIFQERGSMFWFNSSKDGFCMEGRIVYYTNIALSIIDFSSCFVKVTVQRPACYRTVRCETPLGAEINIPPLTDIKSFYALAQTYLPAHFTGGKSWSIANKTFHERFDAPEDHIVSCYCEPKFITFLNVLFPGVAYSSLF